MKPNLDSSPAIQGFASATSVAPGARIGFHVNVPGKSRYTVSIYRIGHYGGAGGRLMTASPRLTGIAQPRPETHPVLGTVSCPWQQTWSLEIPANWTSGLYLACFTTESGERSATPFVVRDGRQSEYLVVLPFTTYQAYNLFPFGAGKSLYYGFLAAGAVKERLKQDHHAYPVRKVPGASFVLYSQDRARAVSFRRPYTGDGFPKVFDIDLAFVQWAESRGYDLSYATSLDLEEGLVRPRDHRALLFSGHDEYWSTEMRSVLDSSLAAGTSLAFFAANNVYWRTRITRDESGFPVMTCHKTDAVRGAPMEATVQWRQLGGHRRYAEQAVLGSQFNGIVLGQLPLTVKRTSHWFWAGTGLEAGEPIPGLLWGESDGWMPDMPSPEGAREHELLSYSRFDYHTNDHTVWKRAQSTSLYRARSGAWVFDAGTFGWTGALNPGARGFHPAVPRATANLMARLRA